MSRIKINLNTKKILERVGQIIGSQNNKKIAVALKVQPQVCTNWKTRNSIPWAKLHIFAIENGISYNWLLTGETDNAFPTTLAEMDLIKILRQCDEEYQKQIHMDATVHAQLEKTYGIINNIKKIVQKNQPPDGIEERREDWIRMKEFLA